MSIDLKLKGKFYLPGFGLEESIKIRGYREGDENQIVNLFRLCFAPETSFDYQMKRWIWEYKENPFGRFIWVAKHKGQIISHHAIVPLNLKVGKKTFRSGIGADSMTHPNYRRKGLNTRIQENSRKEREKAGLYFNFAFANVTRTSKRFRIMSCEMLTWVKSMDSKKNNTFFEPKIIRVEEKARIKRITQFDDRINIFWNDVSKHFNIIVERKKDYLNWRYHKKPNSHLFNILLAEEDDKILGYIISYSHPKDGKGYIVDLLVDPNRPDITQNLIAKTVKDLRTKRVNKIVCHMFNGWPRQNPYSEVLKANGFSSHNASYSLTVRLRSRSKTPATILEAIKNPKNWYLTFGDENGMSTIDPVHLTFARRLGVLREYFSIRARSYINRIFSS